MNSVTDTFTINGITLTAPPIGRQNELLTPDAARVRGTAASGNGRPAFPG